MRVSFRVGDVFSSRGRGIPVPGRPVHGSQRPGLSPSTIYLRLAAESFPKPVCAVGLDREGGGCVDPPTDCVRPWRRSVTRTTNSTARPQASSKAQWIPVQREACMPDTGRAGHLSISHLHRIRGRRRRIRPTPLDIPLNSTANRKRPALSRVNKRALLILA